MNKKKSFSQIIYKFFSDTLISASKKSKIALEFCYTSESFVRAGNLWNIK